MKIQEEDREQKVADTAGGSTSTTLTAPDIISELPTDILLHILGLLEMDKFLIGTSLVSKKWRNLWKYVPTLTFILHPTYIYPGSGIDHDKIWGSLDNDGFVDHVLRLHDYETSRIQIFILSWEYYRLREHGCLERLHNFIITVVNQGAQEIEILGDSYSCINEYMIHINPSIFTTKLLRKFRFKIELYKISNDRHFLFQFPRSMCCATQLTQLVLDGIKLPEGDNSAQLHLVCPVLETLVLDNCYSKHLKVLDISAPRLNQLVISNTYPKSQSDCLGGCRIEIRTPNLTSLIYEGCIYVDCFTENLPRIDDADIDFFAFHEETDQLEKTTSFATKLFKGLTNAKTLQLGGFEVFSQDTIRDLLTPFTSLRTLKLFCNICSIHGMVHLLNSCNSINKFVCRVNMFVKVEGEEHLMLPQCSLSHLKHVHIERLRGHENEVEFVKFLLKSSIVLEDIVISTTDSSKISIEENLKQFIEEELSFRSIKLYVQKYNDEESEDLDE